MRDEITEEAPAEAGEDGGLFLLMKRDLYYRPNAMGYTGIKDHAGRYTKAEAESHADPLSGVTAIAAIDAPDFSPACFDDLARAHLAEKLEQATRELAALRAQPQAREEEGGTLDPAFVAWLRERDCLPNDDDGTIEWADIVCALNDWEADLTQAREDAQPRAWERRWSRYGERKTKDHTPKGWNLYAVTRDKLLPDDKPLFAHPAPDALRVAVEALESIKEVSGDRAASGYNETGRLSRINERCDQALADLQSEQKGGDA